MARLWRLPERVEERAPRRFGRKSNEIIVVQSNQRRLQHGRQRQIVIGEQQSAGPAPRDR